MKLGRLRIVENKEVTGRASKHYHHILVHSRSNKNAEDVVSPGLLDKLASWILSLIG